jgi:hypothetical protein
VGRSRALAWILIAGWLSASFGILAWCAVVPELSWHQLVGVLSLAVSGLAMWAGWARSPQGWLMWDSQAWQWSSHGAPVSIDAPAVVLDLQAALLVKVGHSKAPPGGMFMWIERGSAPALWLAARRALHAKPVSPASVSSGLPLEPDVPGSRAGHAQAST